MREVLEVLHNGLGFRAWSLLIRAYGLSDHAPPQAQLGPLETECEGLRRELEQVQADCGRAAAARAAAQQSKDALLAELLAEKQRVRTARRGHAKMN